MQKSGFLDRLQWGAGAQLAIVDHEPYMSSVAVATPNNTRFPAQVVERQPLTLRVDGRIWRMKQIPASAASMPMRSALPVTYFSVEGEAAQEPEAGPGEPPA